MTSWESLIQLRWSVLNSLIPLIETFKNLVMMMMMSRPRRGTHLLVAKCIHGYPYFEICVPYKLI